MKHLSWFDLNHWRLEDSPKSVTMQIDDVPIQAPIGFIWHGKQKYRVKAGRNVIEAAP